MQSLYLSANDLDKVITSTASNSEKSKLSLLQCSDRVKSNDTSQKKRKACQRGPKKRLMRTDSASRVIKKLSTKNCSM